jgi:hypothetical protein
MMSIMVRENSNSGERGAAVCGARSRAMNEFKTALPWRSAMSRNQSSSVVRIAIGLAVLCCALSAGVVLAQSQDPVPPPPPAGAPLPTPTDLVTEGDKLQNLAAGDCEVTGYLKGKTGYLDRNLLDTTVWTVSSGSAGGFGMNGASTENDRIWDLDPFGRPALVWRSINDAASDADGGWYYSSIPVDPNKAYRLSVWVKKVNPGSGSVYLGCSGSTTLALDGTANGNPYFHSFGTNNVLTPGRWYLLVGYLHASNDSRTTSMSAVYDAVTGKQIRSGTDFKLKADATMQVHRTYNYYDVNAGNIQYFWGPRFEEMDGNQPTIEALLGSASSVALTGLGRRISGDFSTSPIKDRVLIQTNVANAMTGVVIVPNGTNRWGNLGIFNREDPDSAGYGGFSALEGEFRLQSGKTGTDGSVPSLPMTFWTNNGAAMIIDNNQKVGIGTTDPHAKLHVAAPYVDYTTPQLIIDGGAGAVLGLYGGATRQGVLRSDGGGSVALESTGTGGLYFNWSGGSGGASFWNGAGGLLMKIAGTGNVGIGYDNPQYKLHVNGSFAATSKSFEIAHPTKSGMNLVHGSIEGPELGVYYRGEAQLVDGRMVIELPDYFEALTATEGRTVLLTPVFESDESISMLAASAVRDGRFSVRAIDASNPAQRFYWEVKAVRKDVAPLVVERAAAAQAN